MTQKTLVHFVITTCLFLSSVTGYASSVPESCKEFVKYGTPGKEGTLLCRTGYLLAHDSDYKTPIWVVERLTQERASASMARTNNFRPDPDLDDGERAELSDYKGSKFDRGHMAPAGDMRWSQSAMSESFYLSNMVPQVGEGMNRGIWKELEEKVRLWAINRGEVYVYTGPIYTTNPTQTIGTNKVAIPSHLYKIVYDPARVEAIAFIMPNMKLKTSDMPKYIVTVREVEAQTRLNFLSKLKPTIEELVETTRADALWD